MLAYISVNPLCHWYELLPYMQGAVYSPHDLSLNSSVLCHVFTTSEIHVFYLS